MADPIVVNVEQAPEAAPSQPTQGDPLVLIEHAVKGEFQVLKSVFERLYKDAGFEITRVLGQDGEGDIPAAPETATTNVAPASPDVAPVDPSAPVADASVASNPSALVDAAAAEQPAEQAPADAAHEA